MHQTERISAAGIILNTILFVSKITVGVAANSIAIISDALNSLSDVISSIGILFAVKVANHRPDHDHPFGHHRAEPIAALVVAIIAGILGFEIIRSSIFSLFINNISIIGAAAIGVLLFTMIVKSAMAYYFIKRGTDMNRPAIKAAGVESRNDILVSGIALVGVLCSKYNIFYVENISAFFIGIFVIYSGYKIASENIDYLMGASAPLQYLKQIKKAALSIKGVTGIHDVKAHYVGNYIHVEIHVEVDMNTSTKVSHDIGEKVQHKIERLSFIDKAFIHIDPR